VASERFASVGANGQNSRLFVLREYPLVSGKRMRHVTPCLHDLLEYCSAQRVSSFVDLLTFILIAISVKSLNSEFQQSESVSTVQPSVLVNSHSEASHTISKKTT